VEAEVAVATPFSRIGGAAAIDRLVEAFYARMGTLPQARPIRDLHATDLTPVKEVLKRISANGSAARHSIRASAAIRGCACAISDSRSARPSESCG
jgi:hypothetical protein